MTIPVVFVGGPLHEQIGNLSSLEQAQIFFDKNKRSVLCYNRVDELIYQYEPDVSKALTDQYDEAFSKFGETGNAVESWGKKRI